MTQSPPLSLIWSLALGGFLPFAGLALFVVIDQPLPSSIDPQNAFLIWSVVILSFLGGIRWGIALQEDPVDVGALTLSVIPCILGWFALALPAQWAVAILIALYALHGFWDVNALRGRQLAWFAPVRLTLTGLVCLAHAIVLVSVL